MFALEIVALAEPRDWSLGNPDLAAVAADPIADIRSSSECDL